MRSRQGSGRTKPQQPSVRPVQRDTFLDENTPVDGAEAEEYDDLREDKDTHDLAFSPKHVPRASMFDNMLLSLDQISNGTMKEPAVRSGQQDSQDRFNLRSRGHTLSSSVSSENDVVKENIATKSTRSAGRFGRSNSNPKLATNVERMPSIFGEDEPSVRSRVFLAQRAEPKSKIKPVRPNSKSSESSIDLTQMMKSSRLGPPGNRRSQSFDFGSDKNKFKTLVALSQLDAAPMPIVHAGPAARKMPAPVSPQYPPVARKNSPKSSKSLHTRKDRAGTVGAATPKQRAGDTSANIEALPPLPTHLSSPALHYNVENKSHYAGATTPRQGFFRRVFGSNKNTQPGQGLRQESRASGTASAASHEGERPDLKAVKNASVIRTASDKRLPEEGAAVHTSNSKSSHPTLTKKSSSFFRRRKKSLSDQAPIPLPLNLRELHADPGQPSPVTSLRQAMGQYLADGRPSTESAVSAEEESHDAEQTSRGYHTALTSPAMSQDPSNALDPGIHTGTETIPRPIRRAPLPNLQIPSVKKRPNLKVPPSDRNITSFLHDDSSAEPSTRSSNPSPNPEFEKPRSSASNVSAGVPASTGQTAENSRPLSGKTSGTGTPDTIMSRKRPDTSQIGTELWKSGKSSPTVVPTSQYLADISSQISPTARSSSKASFEPPTAVSPRVGAALDPIKVSNQASESDVSVYKSAPSTPLATEDQTLPTTTNRAVIRQPEMDENDKDQALRLFENRDDDIEPENAAAWLGDAGSEREKVRKAYMMLFDFTNQNILTSLRGLCDRIALKGETQQVDRLIDAFAKRWCACNSNHGFKSYDVVHTMCYSILLLNTDLHVAEIGSKMTRAQFVKNTLPTIVSVASDAGQGGAGTPRATTPTKENLASKSGPGIEEHDDVAPLGRRPTDRLMREESEDVESAVEAGPLVTAPFTGTERGWEAQIEIVLKAFYLSISRQRLPLFGATGETATTPASSSHHLMSLTGNMLRRTNSTMSKNGPDTVRGRINESRSATGRWTAKGRSRPRLYPPSAMGSSRTSLDDHSSGWSPGMSSTWSKASLGKTLTSMSIDSFGSEMPRGEYQKSVGFASALSQAFIRDEQADFDSDSEGMQPGITLEDESLGLSGAPWAKEGMLKHKCHLDSVDKKAKDRNWNDCFAVIEKGWLRLFSFSVNAKTLRQKTKERQKAGASAVVGGGNWQDNAEEIWKFLLRQTIASALPPPGYAKNRPFVWALSLPNGAVHLFQVGTPDITKEFVSTANYWSARLSKEPMLGGISNMEYGWSDSVINKALVGPDPTLNLSSVPGARPSTSTSLRSSVDRGSVRPKLPGDKMYINDWRPPQQNTIASQLMEVDQLHSLEGYVKSVEDELQTHNELRPAMSIAFSQRHPNSTRAMTNWERKSSYLLKEIVKFRTYIDSLHMAQSQKEKVYAMRKEDDENALWTKDQDGGAGAATAAAAVAASTF